MSGDETALLQSISAAPDDDLPRLVYADWLEERGEAERAEFIRLQCELASAPYDDPMRPFLVWRHRHLLHTRSAEWRDELPTWPGVEWGDFDRGIIEEVHVDDASVLARHASKIFETLPAISVRFSRLGQARVLNEVTELRRVRVLKMINAGVTREGLRQLLESPYLENVTRLELDCNRFGDAGAIAIGDAQAAVPFLTELWLGGNAIGRPGARALAAVPELERLTVLDLRGNLLRHDQDVQATLRHRFGARVKL